MPPLAKNRSSSVPASPHSPICDDAVPKKWTIAFGREGANGLHCLRRIRTKDINKRGFPVRLPAVEEWVSKRAKVAPNYGFFNDPLAIRGVDESTWPKELRDGLYEEGRLIEALISERERGGAYLKLGCKNQNGLATACGVFNTIYIMDVAIQMLKKAARGVAEKCGQEGVDKFVLIRGDMADDIRPIRDQAVDFAECGFNHFGNLGGERQLLFLRQVNRFMKHSFLSPKRKEIFPLVLTVYKDNLKAKRMQEEFYRNMGLEITTSREEDEIGITTARSPSGNILISERFDLKKIRGIIESANSGLPEAPIRIFQHIDLSETMMALIVYVKKTSIDEVFEGTRVEALDALS
ncbi:MAG: hypothetical protein QXH30_00270 [Candidatus Bilamarchaeaceae archaeon]